MGSFFQPGLAGYENCVLKSFYIIKIIECLNLNFIGSLSYTFFACKIHFCSFHHYFFYPEHFKFWFQIEFPESHYRPPAKLWCEGRRMDDKLVELPHAFRYSLQLSSQRMKDKLVELPHAFRYSLRLRTRRMEAKLVELPHAFRYSLRLSCDVRDRWWRTS